MRSTPCGALAFAILSFSGVLRAQPASPPGAAAPGAAPGTTAQPGPPPTAPPEMTAAPLPPPPGSAPPAPAPNATAPAAAAAPVAAPQAVPPPTPPVMPPPPPSPMAGESSVPPPKPESTIHNHDGFYLRFSGGLGFGSDSISSHYVNSASFKGFATDGQILIGGTPADGLVIGGGVTGPTIGGVSTTVNGKSVTGPKQVRMLGIGPFIDYYFDPHRGFHAQALLGLASLAADDSSSGDDPTGFFATLGCGNEWWVSDQWSIGILGSLMFSSLSYTKNDLDEHHFFFVPTVQATFTYH